GGPVGVEMSQALRRMGAGVALIEGRDHLLPREPEPLGDALGEALWAEGSEVQLGNHVSGAREDGDRCVREPGSSGRRGERRVVAGWTDLGWNPSGSSRARPESRSTRGCGPARESGRSAT